MSDDLGMSALSGTFDLRAGGALAAGCDIALHCSGKMEEMLEVASAVGEIKPQSRARLDRAMATIADAGENAPYEELAAKRDALLAYA